MNTPHRLALFERGAVGGAATALATILGLGCRDGVLDAPLRFAMASATVALPLLLAVYIMKAALQAPGATDKRPPERYRSAAACAFSIASVAIGVSLSAIGTHVYGRLAGLVIGVALVLTVGAALKLDGKFGGEPNHQQ
jgi:hypothetical protein